MSTTLILPADILHDLFVLLEYTLESELDSFSEMIDDHTYQAIEKAKNDDSIDHVWKLAHRVYDALKLQGAISC